MVLFLWVGVLGGDGWIGGWRQLDGALCKRGEAE
jgi:hypothetical protein